MSGDKYNGKWVLIPELCIYQSGEPPISGSYEIQTEDGFTQFQIEWKDKSGGENTIQFGGIANGEKCESDTPGISHVIYQRVSNLILDSTAFNDEEILLYARRAASLDGKILAVSQVLYAKGTSSTNFQVYRREGT